MDLLKEALPHTQLRRIGLASCSLDEAALCALFRDVFPSCLVDTLELSGYDFSSRVVETFAMYAERDTCRLRTVDVSYCGMTRADGARLLSMLSHHNCKLQTLVAAEEAPAVDMQAIVDFGMTERAGLYRSLSVMLSARMVRRLAPTSALRMLPVALIRMVRDMIFLPEAVFWKELAQAEAEEAEEDSEDDEWSSEEDDAEDGLHSDDEVVFGWEVDDDGNY
jgi:hypothetical protein